MHLVLDRVQNLCQEREHRFESSRQEQQVQASCDIRDIPALLTHNLKCRGNSSMRFRTPHLMSPDNRERNRQYL